MRVWLLFSPLLLSACYGAPPPDPPVATVSLVRADGAAVGTVTVMQEPSGLLLRVDARGLPPGRHAIHVHSVGRCDLPNFAGAGGHWNPTARQHGHNNPAGYHQGDLGSAGVGADGRLIVGLLVPGTSLVAPRLSAPLVLSDVDGASLVIHSGDDDEVTDPSGNSGARIACAVLTQ